MQYKHSDLPIDLIALFRLNPFASSDYYNIQYTFNSQTLDVVVIKLDVSDGNFYLIFSLPRVYSKNIFLAVCENEFKTASLCVAYCDYYVAGNQANFGEYILFDQVEIDSLTHIQGIILLNPSDSVLLESYGETLAFRGKDYMLHWCLAFDGNEEKIWEENGLYALLEHFESVGKDGMKF